LIWHAGLLLLGAFDPRRLLLIPPAPATMSSMTYLFTFVSAKDQVVWFKTKIWTLRD